MGNYSNKPNKNFISKKKISFRSVGSINNGVDIELEGKKKTAQKKISRCWHKTQKNEKYENREDMNSINKPHT